MAVQQTTFCFVCSHLASGEKDGDAARRNWDVMEILRRTRFSQNHPHTILDHQYVLTTYSQYYNIIFTRASEMSLVICSNIIWLGDLNYRLASRSTCGDIYDLLNMNDWQALLLKDEVNYSISQF